jgi:aspartyl-tRNA(Asn)/glutamyl-tRNA(Gln) amidotransferase subunit B
MNSMRAVERAIGSRSSARPKLIDGGGTVHMETRGWDEPSQSTYHMRPKEEENDYRYFPEPDLPPLLTTPEWLAEIKARLPELPSVRRRATSDFGLSAYDAERAVNDAAATALFEGRVGGRTGVPAKLLANWVTGEYMRLAKGGAGPRLGRSVRAGRAAGSVVADGAISGTNAKEVFAEHFVSGENVRRSSRRAASARSPTPGRSAAIDDVLAANPAAVADYRAGKAAAVGFLVGQVMKATRGQANAAMVQTALRERLDSGRVGRGRARWARSTWSAGSLGVLLIVVGYNRARGPWGATRS